MSYSDDFWAAMNNDKKKKKKEEESKGGGSSYTEEFYAALDDGVNRRIPTINSISGNAVREDIAPVREDRTWFKSSGAFDDGYDFGDITRTILGTANDIQQDVASGLYGIAESTIDTGAYLVGGASKLFGADDFANSTRDFIKQDIIDEERLGHAFVNNSVTGWIENLINGNWEEFNPLYAIENDIGVTTERNSLLGDKTDSLVQSGGQLLGTVGLQSVGVPWFLTTGVTSFGSSVEQAFNEDADYLEAGASGLISAGADILTEKLFGGSGLGEKGLINLEPLTKGIANKVVKTLTDFGVNTVSEGVEEVAASIFQNLGTALYKDENVWDILWNEEAVDNYIESFIGGAALGGVMNASHLSNSLKKGQDYNTGLTASDEKVINKLHEDVIAEQEANGEKLTSKDKTKLYNEIVEQVKKGAIDIDTIESVLGGDDYKTYKDRIAKEDALKKELDELSDIKDNELTRNQRKRLEQLEAMNLSDTSVREGYRKQFDKILSPQLKNSQLLESYRERDRSYQTFETDLNQYKGTKHEDAAKKTIENAIKAGANNTNRVHGLVDMLAKISADEGTVYDFGGNKTIVAEFVARQSKQIAKLENIPANQRTEAQNKLLAQKKELLADVQSGKVKLNGTISGGNVKLNLDSQKPLNRVVGHELTHWLDKAKSYEELQEAVFKYAKTKGVDVDAKIAEMAQIYEGVDGEAKAELVADLVGDYLFTDEDFVRNLSVEHRNVFQKAYDSIKYMLKMATTGSQEARELEKVKRTFEKVYQERAEMDESGDAKTKYSIRKEAPPKETGIAYKVFFVKDGKLYPPMVANPDGADTPMGVWLNADVGVSAPPSKTGRAQVKAGGKGTQGGSGSLAFRPGWHLGDLPRASQFDRVNPETGKKELFPENFVWAEVEYAKDVDYQEEAMSYGYTDNGKFRHAYAGLPRLPENGYYRYRTNPKPDTVPWVITGAMKVNRLLSDAEVNEILEKNGVAPVHRQGGDVGLDKFGFDESGTVKYSISKDGLENIGNILYNNNNPLSIVNRAKSNNNSSIKWVYNSEIFSVLENKLFHEKISEINQGSQAFQKNSIDEYMLPIENKIVFTDGNYDSPYVREIVEVLTDSETEFEAIKEVIFNVEKGESTKQDALRYVQNVYGKGRVITYTSRNDGVYGWEDGRRKGKTRRTVVRNYLKKLYGSGNDSQINETEADLNGSASFNSDTSFPSSSDSDGNQLSKEQQEYFSDSKVRDENGSLKIMYHGTNTPNFTVFDPSFSDDKISLFFTDSPDVADSYTTVQHGGRNLDPYRLPNTIKTLEEYNDYMKSIGSETRIIKVTDEVIEKATKDIEALIAEDERRSFYRNRIDELKQAKGKFIHYNGGVNYVTRSERIHETATDAIQADTSDKYWTPHQFGSRYSVYLNLKNPYILDAGKNHKGVGSLEIRNEVEDATARFTINGEDFEISKDYSESYEDFAKRFLPQNEVEKFLQSLEAEREKSILEEMELFDHTREKVLADWAKYGESIGAFKYEAKNASIDYTESGVWKDLEFEGNRGNTRDLAKWAKENGYDGVIVKNVRDIGGFSGGTVKRAATIAIAFDSNQVKSTLNKNPTSDPDIRFSLSKSVGNQYSPASNFDVYGKDFGVQGAEDIAPVAEAAPVQEAVAKTATSEEVAPTIPKSERIADGSRSDELLYESLDNYPMQTVEQKIAEKIRATQGEIADKRDLRRESWENYESQISNLRERYNSKKNKNTKEASKILESISRLERLKASRDAELAKGISDLEARVERMSDPQYNRAMQKQAVMEANAKWAEDLVGDTSTWVDKKIGFQYATNTERRNLRDIVRDADGNVDIAHADAIDDALNGRYNREEAEKKRELAKARGKYAALKITRAEDAYIQMLGELRYNPETTQTEQSVSEYYEKHKRKIDADKVDKIIEMARRDYDDWLNRVNAELRKQGMKEIPYRQGYFPHYTEPKQNFIQKLLNWKTQDNEIPTSIAGLTETFKPTRSWQSFDKTRYSDETDYSFTKGFDSYSEGVLDWIYHMDTLQKRRAVENHIRYTHSEEGIRDRIKQVYANEEWDANEAQAQIEHILSEAKNPLNNFVQDFTTHTNILAGKKNSLDRTVEQATNRHIYSVMTNVQNRLSANMVLANVRSALTNFIPITQSWAQVSPARSLQAAKDTIANAIKDDGTVDKSTFLTNRLREVDKLYQTNWDKVLDKAGIMFEIVDNFSSQVIWRSKYNQNLAKGMSESAAIKNADQFAENVMAGRSKGNEPTLFNSKNPFIKAFTAFQLEVNNQYGYLFKDVPNDLKAEAEHWKFNLAKGYTTAFIGAYVYNALLEEVTGSDAALDPIGIIEDLLLDLGLFDDDDEEEDPAKIATNLVTNVVEELPFVGGLLGGGRIPISSALPYSDDGLAGFIEDVSEGDLVNIGKELMNPVLNVGLPVAGGQIKKTTQGLGMFSDDHPVTGSYTDSGNLRFPVEDTPLNRVQAAIFGQYASENAREYFDNGYAPLKEKQIQEYKDVDIPIKDYWEYREGLAKQETLEDKFDYIAGLDLPVYKKNILINNVVDRKESVDLENYDDFSSLEEFDYATKNPEKYAFAKSVGGYSAYKTYSDALYDIKADKDEYGKSISGSRKEKVIDYINNLDADYETKIILFKSEYPSDDTYNAEIINYLNNRGDLTYEERVAIFTELGFRVYNGTVYWD